MGKLSNYSWSQGRSNGRTDYQTWSCFCNMVCDPAWGSCISGGVDICSSPWLLQGLEASTQGECESGCSEMCQVAAPMDFCQAAASSCDNADVMSCQSYNTNPTMAYCDITGGQFGCDKSPGVCAPLYENLWNETVGACECTYTGPTGGGTTGWVVNPWNECNGEFGSANSQAWTCQYLQSGQGATNPFQIVFDPEQVNHPGSCARVEWAFDPMWGGDIQYCFEELNTTDPSDCFSCNYSNITTEAWDAQSCCAAQQNVAGTGRTRQLRRFRSTPRSRGTAMGYNRGGKVGGRGKPVRRKKSINKYSRGGRVKPKPSRPGKPIRRKPTRRGRR